MAGVPDYPAVGVQGKTDVQFLGQPDSLLLLLLILFPPAGQPGGQGGFNRLCLQSSRCLEHLDGEFGFAVGRLDLSVGMRVLPLKPVPAPRGRAASIAIGRPGIHFQQFMAAGEAPAHRQVGDALGQRQGLLHGHDPAVRPFHLIHGHKRGKGGHQTVGESQAGNFCLYVSFPLPAGVHQPLHPLPGPQLPQGRIFRAGRRRGHFDNLLKWPLGRFAGDDNFTLRLAGIFSQQGEGPQGKEVREGTGVPRLWPRSR